MPLTLALWTELSRIGLGFGRILILCTTRSKRSYFRFIHQNVFVFINEIVGANGHGISLLLLVIFYLLIVFIFSNEQPFE